ncbi:glutaredoxin family protein [Pseudoalteromonas sp. MMG013]|uniref:glutaredoxin family protein n=1 Tax=unclassified Pseudoalteromonas TaxID=194690 RepID=UPI001B394A27|nr:MULTISPECIES: glutaredoxin family protein [unclassified Pseudoalteromonas]MBQ4845580.1 glutaredoxin family protein [Pseudoalteromonas sp. MMG005]MBQ4848904.1 glutaredoxin family protein [Pseudoalteromonas sp. MMG012]MBQ4863400.1 glutaredoxin family protein [Pseudoalteromonas sp. MMG013]
MAKYVLYHTDGCHLCEQAYELALHAIHASDIKHVDITGSEELMQRFQTTIPVLERKSDHQQLTWPFELTQIQQLVE